MRSVNFLGDQFLKAALVVHWLPCVLLRALALRANERREEEER